MKSSREVLWLGWICLLAGIARMGMTPTAYVWGTDSVQELTFGFIACILMSVGSIVLYQVQARETGVLGFISVLGITVGNIVTTAMVFMTFALGTEAPPPEGPIVGISQMVNMVGLLGGTLLFAVMTFQAKVFPRWIAVLNLLIILSMFLPLEDNKLFAGFWGLAYVGMGLCIVTGKLNRRADLDNDGLGKTVGA